MPDETCSQCGRQLSKEAPRGLCPNCLLAAALQDTAEGQTISEVGAPAPTPERFGNYEIVGVLGEGGMGTVYLAVQQQPIRRRVAIKVVKKGMDSRQILSRFQAERQTLAMMDHQAIAKIYEAGTGADGQPYFVMEYVQGIPITDYCDRNLLGYRDRLELFREVCRAVHHAHQKGIIHRDLKPSNILVGVVDGKPAPKIIDFGLARVLTRELTEETMFTEFGVLMGTPEYMSPEQAESGSLNLDVTTDIYALGVILYELLVGVLPFDGKTLRRAGLEEIRRIIREVEPPPPSVRLQSLGAGAVDIARRRQTNVAGMARQLRGELEWITMKALDKDRTRRYASASEFGADLERHLNQEPVTAGAPGASYRLQKLVRRHRGKLVAASLLLLALLAGLIASSTLYLRAEQNHRIADWEAYKARLAAANVEIEGFRSEQAKQLLFQCPVALRGWEWRHLYARADSSMQTMKLPVSGSPIAQIGFRGDSSRFWVASGSRVFEVDVPTGAIAATHGPFGIIAAMTRDARLVVSRPPGLEESAVEVRDVNSGKTISKLSGHQAPIVAAAFDRDGGRLATASLNGEIHLWEPESGKNLLTIHGPPVELRNNASYPFDDTLALSPDGSRIVFSLGVRMLLWDVRTGKQIAELPGYLTPNNSVFFTDQGDRILSGSDSVRIWDSATGRMIGSFTPYLKSPIRLAVPSPDSSTVLVVGMNREVLLYHWKSGLVFTTLTGMPPHVATAAAFSPDARFLVFAASGGEVKVWDGPSMGGNIAYKTWAASQQRTESLLLSMAISADAGRIAEGMLGGKMEVWETASGKVLLRQEHQPWEQRPRGPILLALNSRGTLLAVGNKFGIQIWDVEAAVIRSDFRDLPQPLTALAFSPNGLQLAAACDRSVRTWEIPSGNKHNQINFPVQIRALAFSPDGKKIAVGMYGSAGFREAAAQIIDSESGKISAKLALEGGLESPVAALAFSRDGLRLAVMRSGLASDVWNARTWRQLGALRTSVHSEPVSVSFTPDGRQVVSTDASQTLTIWNVDRFEPVMTLHLQAGKDLFIPPDGATVYTNIGAVRVFSTYSSYPAEADELIYSRLNGTSLMCDVRLSLEEDQGLSPELRVSALRALERRADAQESWLHLEETLARNNLAGAAYQQERKRAEAMARWFPGVAAARLYLAFALYRTGAYQEAVDALITPNAAEPPFSPPARLGVLAMAFHRLNQPQKAHELLDQARVLMKAPMSPGRRDYCTRVLGEAEKLIENKSP